MLDPIHTLLIAIYAQGVFHLNTRKVKISCSTNCYYSKYCKWNWSQAEGPLRGPLSLVAAHYLCQARVYGTLLWEILSIVYLKFYRCTWGISIDISKKRPTAFESPIAWLIVDLFSPTILINFYISLHYKKYTAIHWNNIYPTLTHPFLLLSDSTY